ncbi:DUF2280 domain-containing protein [Xinfangfangia sp. D13-10-4-6]|uniref:DUF2280 domain-containing protein n=1 Tax=Pseudogemmobacter hezensis TaxID=2737662 RepID=UPI001551CA86|nr:DUF2280 domain-containing protein [Pseudogemmobacter hezensis]NPD17582.1 DUF2280 domain-containing protein [Pseudogemmobacter hezensis]
MVNGGVKLSDEVKTYIVQALACFDPPSVVVASVKQDFGQVVSRQAVEGYDPNKRAGRNLSKRWRAIFEETRKTFLEDTATIGISHRAVRLRALQRMADKSEGQGNMVLASSLLEQAAKEVGGSYTNRREVTGANGGPMEVRGLADFYADLAPKPEPGAS